MVSHFAQEKTKEHKLAKPQQQPNSLDSEKLYAKDSALKHGFNQTNIQLIWVCEPLFW